MKLMELEPEWQACLLSADWQKQPFVDTLDLDHPLVSSTPAAVVCMSEKNPSNIAKGTC